MRESRTHLDSFSVADIGDSVAWYNQGDRLANQGHYADALTCFEEVLGLRPDYAPAWVFRGVMLIHLERYEEALESCKKALSLQPTDSEAWIFHGVALHRLGHYKNAYISYNRALGIRQPSLWHSLLNRLRKAWKVLKSSQAHWLS